MNRWKKWLASLTVLLQVGGCGGLRPLQAEDEIQPSSARLGERLFTTADGTALPYGHWGDISDPAIVLVAVHGMNDYHHAFSAPAAVFANAGVATYAYDQRGHGGAPDAGQWAGHTVMARDLVDFLALVHRRHPRVPLFLLGESMGGAISVLAATDPQAPSLAGLILSSPAIRPKTATRKPVRLATQLAGNLLPDVAFPTPPTMSSRMTDNKDVLAEMATDPLIPKEISVGILAGVGAAMEAAAGSAGDLRVPTLLLLGAHDPLLTDANRQRLSTLLKGVIGELDITVYPDGYHLLLRDRQASRVFTRIIDWLRARSESGHVSARAPLSR